MTRCHVGFGREVLVGGHEVSQVAQWPLDVPISCLKLILFGHFAQYP